MDTGTHVVMGVALTGLATLDPHVTPTFAAVATGIMVGSQIPDIDTVLKLKIMRYMLKTIEVSLIQYLLHYYGL